MKKQYITPELEFEEMRLTNICDASPVGPGGEAPDGEAESKSIYRSDEEDEF